VGARTRLILAVAMLAVGAVPLAGLVAGGRPPSTPDAAALLERLPVAFEENVGQLDPTVQFAARMPGQTVLLTDDGLVVSPAGVGLTLEGAARTGLVGAGERRLAGTVNRFTGDDSTAWRTAIPTYGAVTYRGVYPGIDLTYYGTGRLVEHDFVVAPGADPVGIRFAVTGGATPARIDRTGTLVAGDVSLRPPVLYQDVDGARRPVEGRYATRGDGRFGFEVGPYDRSHPLVIDPVMVSSSYLGGTSTDTAYAVAVDVDGNVAVVGYTESPDFPVVSPAQAALAQEGTTRTDVFVTKVKADGGTVLWSTYLGGKGRDAAFGVAVGPDAGVWVTGYAESTDFPTVRPLQPANAGASDVFVAKLNSAGSALDFSTFLGGSGADSASGIAVDRNGAVFVAGSTGSANFPKVRPLQANLSRPDDVDGFVLRIEPNGASLNWSTFLGGAGDDHANDVALDSESNVYVTGDTKSANFPTVRPFQPGPGGAATGGAAGSFSDAFVTKVRPDGSALVYSSYLGGADSDKGTGIAVDGQGAAYVAGNTGSTNFPVEGAVQAKKDGDFDAFVTKVRPDGSGIAYSTYLGGAGSDGAEAIAVDDQGHAHVTGATASSNFPSAKGFQAEKGGGFVDAFVTEVGASGSSLVSSSYLGGKDDDQAAGIALDRNGNPVIVGYTNSADFPVKQAFQPGKGGGVGDAFITKAQGDDPAAGDNPAAAAERRDRRIRTLITVTGGLFLAALLQGVWLRRRPESAPRPAPRPAAGGAGATDAEDEEPLDVPGVRYVPRRGPAVLPPVKLPQTKVRAGWGDERPGPDERREPARPPQWTSRRLEEALENALKEAPVGSRMAAPDLWAPDVDDAELAQARVTGIDMVDLWGPLSVEQDPDEWVAEWAREGLLESPATAAPPPVFPADGEPPEAMEDEVEPEDGLAPVPASRRAVPPPPPPAPPPVLPPAPLPAGLRSEPGPEPVPDSALALTEPDAPLVAQAPESRPEAAHPAPVETGLDVQPPPAAARPAPEPTATHTWAVAPPTSEPMAAETQPARPPAGDAAPERADLPFPEPVPTGLAEPPPPPGEPEPGEDADLPFPFQPGPPSSAIAAWATGAEVNDDRPPFVIPSGGEGFGAAARPAEPPPHDDWLVDDPSTAGPADHPPPQPDPRPPALSIDELLSEDLPIPEPSGAPTENEKARIWLRDLLDEELAIPDPAAVTADTTDVPEPEQDYVPPPPSRLLTNLFEPDPDDPLVQSLRAREAEEDGASES